MCIESDWFWSTIRTGFIQPWLPESAKQTRVVAGAYAAASAQLARGGYFVVLEGVVGPWLLDVEERELSRDEVGFVYVVLRVPRDVVIARAEGRKDEEVGPGLPALTDPAPTGQLWDQFSDLGDYEENVLDASGLDPAETALKIWERYEAGLINN